MKAIVKAAAKPGNIICVDKAISEPGPQEVKLKILAAGICGTDLAIFRWPSWIAPRVNVPITIGHEGFGVIEAVGSGVTHLRVGQKVGIESHIYCGSCYNCLTGSVHICNNLTYIGQHLDGVFAEYAVLPANIMFPVEDDVSAELGVLLEPFGLAVRACMSGSGVSGRSVLITGGGPLGMMAYITAKHLGARSIIISEVNPYRLDFARGYVGTSGTNRVVDPSKEDLTEIAKDLTDGNGADVWIDFAGGEKALQQGFTATRSGGEARIFTASDRVTLDMTQFILREVSVTGFHGRLIFKTWFEEVPLLSLLKDQLLPLITHRLTLDRYEEAFELLESGEAMKVIFEVN